MTAPPARPPVTTSATRTSTINDGNWATATQVTGEPTPAAAGTNQNMTVSGLSADTTYYFAMKTADEVPNCVGPVQRPQRARPRDTVAPAAVSNLATGSPTTSSITLTWTAPGDDGSTGTATSYDIRYSHGSAINDRQLGQRHAGHRRTDPGGSGHQPEHGRQRPVRQHDLLLRHQDQR